MTNPSRRRFFAIRAAQAKKAESTILLRGVPVKITETNRMFVERLRDRDAEAAYEAAAFGREHISPIALAA